jgi:hypothetical protein
LKVNPSATIFGHKGPTIFTSTADEYELLGIGNAKIFELLLSLQMAFGSYEVGVIQRTPIPNIKNIDSTFRSNVKKIVGIKFHINTHEETCHQFVLPVLIHYKKNTLFDSATIWEKMVVDLENQVQKIQNDIDSIAYECYKISQTEREKINRSLVDRPLPLSNVILPFPFETNNLLSYLFGILFGRWDIRYATGEKQLPELPDPFAPLPACSPGMLQGEDGLPRIEAPPGYTLKIDDDGILVDDEYHPEDIITRLREVLTLIWGEKADSIEREACEILGVKLLRDYFRKPGAGGFWDSHVKRYSKSRRKAPIYWLLQSSKRNYGLWIYYHRLTPDTLFRALERYVKPKIQMEETRLAEMQSELKNAGTGGAVVKKLEKAVEKQELFVGELSDFKEKLERAASLFLEPDLDDGVVLTIAPLHELVPWKEAGAYWDELLEGKYEWSSIGKQMREKGMVKE